MRHHARLVTIGGYGLVAKPIAYDLAKGRLVDNARLNGAVRYGKKSSETDDDRPLSVGFRQYPSSAASLMSSWDTSLTANAGLLFASLSDWTNPLLPGGGESTRFQEFAAADDTVVTFTTKSAIIGANTPWGINLYVEEQDAHLKNRGTKPIVWLEWGMGDKGFMFQVIDNSPSIAQKSKDWNEAEANTLRHYQAFGKDVFSPVVEGLIAEGIKKLYADYQELSLENSTDRGDWSGQVFNLTFVPEPRGAIHILASSGGDPTRYDVNRILKTKKAGEVWSASKLTVGSLAASMSWQVQEVVYLSEATVEFGPLPKAGEGPVDTTETVSADETGGAVTFQPFYPDSESDVKGDMLYGLGEGFFGLRLTMTAGGDGATAPWVYRASSRTNAGEREASTTQNFDSDDVDDPSPVMDVSIETEMSGRRSARVTMRDVNGRTTSGAGSPRNTSIHAIRDRMAALTVTNPLFTGPLFTQALVTGGRAAAAAHYAVERGGNPAQLSIDISKGETLIEVDLSDGWAILDETTCSPPPILDGRKLGAGLHEVLQLAGQSLYAGAGLGVTLPVPSLGGPYALVPDGDSTCGDVLRSLMDRFGLGYRFYQDNMGRWQFEAVDQTPKFAFVSNHAINSPDTEEGRNCILNPLDWQADNRDFYNFFRVIGGDDGAEIEAEWTIHESISNPNFANWIGRLRPYPTLRDTSLNDSLLVQIALRSMVQRYGKIGRYAQFTTYCRFDLYPGDRGTIDGLPCEIDSIQGCSIAGDQMQIVVREIV
jgi:hypothetical protein